LTLGRRSALPRRVWLLRVGYGLSLHRDGRPLRRDCGHLAKARQLAVSANGVEELDVEMTFLYRLIFRRRC